MTAHILFVDDDESNLLVFDAMCGEDFPVLTAPSADVAMELLDSHEIGVLLTDQRMPGKTGVDLLEHARKRSPTTVRILVTAYSDLQAAVEAINRGHVRRYLRKPWEADALKAELRDALDIYRMSRQVRGLEARLVETERVYALGVVAAGVGHELRNPVGWMGNTLEMIRALVEKAQALLVEPGAAPEEVGALLDKVREYMGDAELGVGRIMEVVRGLEMPVRAVQDGSVDLGEVVELALRITRSSIQRTARIELHKEPVRPVRGSRDRIGQILLNLLVNAQQAVADLPQADSRVDVYLHGDEDYVYVEVSDSGEGIPEGQLEEIFNPFFTTKGAQGTGLGLAISRRIARESGGDLEAENLPRGGARFRLKLPVRLPTEHP